jgi:hypothetical protein
MLVLKRSGMVVPKASQVHDRPTGTGLQAWFTAKEAVFESIERVFFGRISY